MSLAAVRDLVIGPDHGPPVVDGVSFTVSPGRVVALVGPSGAGKSTAALSLLGHLRPGLRRISGTVVVDGRDPFTHGGELRGRVVTHLGQDASAALNPARRIGSLLAEAVRSRLPGCHPATEVAGLLTSVGLPADRDFTRRRPHQVSGGQAQRVALALALAGRPRLIVFDEPTSALDRRAADTVRELIAGTLRQRGLAGVLVSHDRDLVDGLADQVVTVGRRRPVTPARPGTAVPLPAPEAPSVLSVRGLTARHGARTVVTGVSLDLRAGDCLALTGPSGGGKSTIARCLVGLHAPTAGSITLDGRPLAARHQRRDRAQRGAVQLVAQDCVGALNPRESVRSALARPLRTDDTATLTALLARVRLPGSVLDRRPAALSGGERQRVNLARALAARPRVLICDEVTSALDADTACAVLDLLSELRGDQSLAVLLITHDPDTIARAADGVAVLTDGMITVTRATRPPGTSPRSRPGTSP